MPNHWESSGRPLFVKTLFVNGSRHAILSHEDPLLHSKKQNNSPSFSSNQSISSSESQDSASEKGIPNSKIENPRRVRNNDLSSDLQDCLIKLRLPSSRTRPPEECIFYNEQAENKWKKNDNFKQKRKKGSGGNKLIKKKSYTHCHQELVKENAQVEPENGTNGCYYVYGFENNKKKKNYCCVKISSNPSKFILNCSCDKNSNCGENYNSYNSKHSQNSTKSNVLLSATFQNFIMSVDQNEKLSKKSPEYFFPFFNPDYHDLSWSNYLARSFYNSLSERVIQWLDLSNKRIKKDNKSESIKDEVSCNNIERIFAGRRFIDENNMSISGKPITPPQKMENKIVLKKEREKMARKESFDEDVEAEVKGEINVETALSSEKFKDDEVKSNEHSSRSEKVNETMEKQKNELENPEMISIPTKIEFDSSVSVYLKDSIACRLHSPIQSLTTTPFVQEMEAKSDSAESGNNFLKSQNKKKSCKEKRNIRQSRECKQCAGETESDDEDFKITAIKYWEKKVVNAKNKRNGSGNKLETCKETCNCDRNSDEYQRQLKNRTPQDLLDKNYKSIDNHSITRSFLGQNLSVEQPNKITWLREGKHTSEKDMGRPQLHIFMPFASPKDQSEESVSEAESYLSEVL